MNDVDLTGINLNLLVALDLLLRERSVTRAAEQLGVTQSAMSHSLRQLRDLLGDPLLVRGRAGMERTPRAEGLLIPLQTGLQSLRQVIAGVGVFDPSRVERRFAIAAGDAVSTVILGRLLPRLRAHAPGISLDIVPFELDSWADELETGIVDLAVAVRFPDAPAIKLRRTGPEHFVCLTRADHPAVGNHLDLDTFTKLPHLLVSPQGEGGPGVVDKALSGLGLKRKVLVRTRYFLAAPLLLENSDLVLTIWEAVARLFLQHHNLRQHDPPLDLPSFRWGVAWHERVDQDPASLWLREEVLRALASSEGGAPEEEGARDSGGATLSRSPF